MKRLLLILIPLLLLFAAPSVAQTTNKDTTQTSSGAERVQALKVAFITKRLDLTSSEAEKFWPVYNVYQDKRDAVRKEQNQIRKKIKEQADQLSDAELTKLSDREMELRKQDVALQAELYEKLKTVLSPKKLALLSVAEDEFKKELLKILTEDNSSGNGGNPK